MADQYNSITVGDHYKVPPWLTLKLQPFVGYNPVILDLGCASGTVGNILGKLNIQPAFLFGADVSNKMVEKCRTHELYNNVVQWDLSKGFPEPKYFLYDIVTALGILEFLDSPIVILNDIYNSLKIGGSAFLTFEATEQNQADQTVTFNLEIGKFERYSKTKDNILELIEKSHLSLVDISHGSGYQSPKTGKIVDYYFCHLKRMV
jgi:predicted TPR repeat methyltransferase